MKHDQRLLRLEKAAGEFSSPFFTNPHSVSGSELTSFLCSKPWRDFVAQCDADPSLLYRYHHAAVYYDIEKMDYPSLVEFIVDFLEDSTEAGIKKAFAEMGLSAAEISEILPYCGINPYGTNGDFIEAEDDCGQ